MIADHRSDSTGTIDTMGRVTLTKKGGFRLRSKYEPLVELDTLGGRMSLAAQLATTNTQTVSYQFL